MNKLLQLKNISKSYDNKSVLDNINLQLDSGDILGYIGPNGAGKTTTMKIICGLTKMNSGEIIIDNNQSGNPYKIGVIFDFNGLYLNMTAKENLLYYLKLYDIEKKLHDEEIEKALKLVNLNEVKDKKVKTFSKGMLRRLVIARTLIQSPNILILDEPFDGLDVESHYIIIRFFENWVKNGDRCILLTSHNMKEVAFICNKLAIINDGVILENATIKSILNDNFKCLRIHLRNTMTKNSIEKLFHGLFDKIILHDNELSIYTDKSNNEKIINKIITNEIQFSEIKEVTFDLEEIYMKKVGRNE